MDIAFQALVDVLSPASIFFMLAGIFVSSTFVALPGFDTKLGLAILIPFIIYLEPVLALSLMVSTYAVSNTANSITSILFAVPGGSGSQATILDGYRMARQGKAGQALSASFTASAIGGIFGALFFLVFIPFMPSIILWFGPVEMLMLVFSGLLLIGALSGTHHYEGIALGLIGMMLGTVGIHYTTGQPRFTMDNIYLMDGFHLIPVVMGLFAMPELISLYITNSTISKTGTNNEKTPVRDGIQKTFQNLKLVFQTSIIGTWIGFVPGLGGAITDWVAYAFCKSTLPNRENIGKGDVRGVIAIDAATNAKEGGALVPAMLFGLPGSSTVAILLSAFSIIGIQPGITLIIDTPEIPYVIFWILVISTIITSVALLFMLPLFNKITVIRPEYLVPFLMLMITVGTYAVANSFYYIWAMMAFTVFGMWLKLHNLTRVPLLIGFLLGPIAERLLETSVQLHGWSLLYHPAVIGGLCTVFAVVLLFKRAVHK
jgi:putative tricarboxylic transport membrane protein